MGTMEKKMETTIMGNRGIILQRGSLVDENFVDSLYDEVARLRNA